jgi:predicted dienelactone hydrolase
VKRILDQFDFIEDSVLGLKGRLERSRIAATGHSFGAQTTAMLLGARMIVLDGSLGDAGEETLLARLPDDLMIRDLTIRNPFL